MANSTAIVTLASFRPKPYVLKYYGLVMDENRYRQIRNRPSTRSLDGFVVPTAKQRIVPNNRRINLPSSNTTPSPRTYYPPTQVSIPSRSTDTQSAINPSPSSVSTSPSELTTHFSSDVERAAPKKRKKSTKKKVILRSILVMFLIVFGVGGYLGVKALSTLNSIFHGNIISDATAAFNETPLKGEENGRVNILLAGDSVDDPNHAGANLTDSILLLSIDTQNHSAFLLSIPRDLWTYIPGLSSYQKINTANTVSNFHQSGYPSGGMGELEQIIQTQLGIPVDYYGLMDYGAFKDSVDAVGGVTINIQSSNPRGLYDPYTNLKLPNGIVNLDGEEALNLARARGDGPGSYGFPDSDFDRTDHQRELFLAVASKAKTLGVLANPVKISDLFSALGNNLQTDLSLQNVLRLIQITKNISLTNIQSYAFSSTLSSTTPNPILMNYTDPSSGEEALIPSAGIGDFGQLTQYYQQLTSDNPVVKEAPSVVILNASNVNGLASAQRTTLQSKGFNVSAIADANNEYPGTMIVDNTKGTKPNSLKFLQQMYQGTTVTSQSTSTEATEAQGYTADFVVILGQNWQSATR